MGSANRDPEQFPDPDTFDITGPTPASTSRSATGSTSAWATSWPSCSPASRCGRSPGGCPVSGWPSRPTRSSSPTASPCGRRSPSGLLVSRRTLRTPPVDGFRLAVDVHGAASGERTDVLLHGWPGDRRTTGRSSRCSRGGHAWLSPTCAGSATPTGTPSRRSRGTRRRRRLRSVLGLLDHTGGAVAWFVGYDIGSRLVQHLLSTAPGRVLGAVLTPAPARRRRADAGPGGAAGVLVPDPAPACRCPNDLLDGHPDAVRPTSATSGSTGPARASTSRRPTSTASSTATAGRGLLRLGRLVTLPASQRGRAGAETGPAPEDRVQVPVEVVVCLVRTRCSRPSGPTGWGSGYSERRAHPRAGFRHFVPLEAPDAVADARPPVVGAGRIVTMGAAQSSTVPCDVRLENRPDRAVTRTHRRRRPPVATCVCGPTSGSTGASPRCPHRDRSGTSTSAWSRPWAMPSPTVAPGDFVGRRFPALGRHLFRLPSRSAGELPARGRLRRLPGRGDPGPERRRHAAGHPRQPDDDPRPSPAGAVRRHVHRLARRRLRGRAGRELGRGGRGRRGRPVRRAGRRPARCDNDRRDEPARRPAGPPREFGATHVVAERGADGLAAVRELTDGIGADCVLECVGTEEARAQAVPAPVRAAWSAWSWLPHGDLPTEEMFWANKGRAGRAGAGPCVPAAPVDLVWRREIDPGGSSTWPCRWRRSPRPTRRWTSGGPSRSCCVPDRPGPGGRSYLSSSDLCSCAAGDVGPRRHRARPARIRGSSPGSLVSVRGGTSGPRCKALLISRVNGTSSEGSRTSLRRTTSSQPSASHTYRSGGCQDTLDRARPSHPTTVGVADLADRGAGSTAS